MMYIYAHNFLRPSHLTHLRYRQKNVRWLGSYIIVVSDRKNTILGRLFFSFFFF